MNNVFCMTQFIRNENKTFIFVLTCNFICLDMHIQLPEAKSVGISIKSAPSDSSSTLSEELKKLILAFYSCNDVSWQTSGRNERVLIWEVDKDGEKIRKTEQVWYVLMSMKETYSKFVEGWIDQILHASPCQCEVI